MNVLRLLVAVAVVGALTLGARAEEKKADNAKLLVGTWEVVKADQGTAWAGSAVEFAKDGKMTVTHKKDGKEEKGEGIYRVEGDTFFFVVQAGDTAFKKTVTIKKISETELSTVDEDGKAVELKRKK